MFSILRENDYSKIYVGNVVDLAEDYRLTKEEAADGVPCVFYRILLHGRKTCVGNIDLRLKMDERMYYFGHVGYYVNFIHRGKHYAYHACRLLFKIAHQEFGLDELIITCSPDNIASYKTLVKLGGEYLDTVNVPQDHELYRRNEKVKCIFRFRL